MGLKKVRVSQNFTQEEVALLLGISVRQYRRIESGESDSRPKLWDKLEDLFGVDQRELRKPETA